MSCILLPLAQRHASSSSVAAVLLLILCPCLCVGAFNASRFNDTRPLEYEIDFCKLAFWVNDTARGGHIVVSATLTICHDCHPTVLAVFDTDNARNISYASVSTKWAVLLQWSVDGRNYTQEISSFADKGVYALGISDSKTVSIDVIVEVWQKQSCLSPFLPLSLSLSLSSLSVSLSLCLSVSLSLLSSHIYKHFHTALQHLAAAGGDVSDIWLRSHFVFRLLAFHSARTAVQVPHAPLSRVVAGRARPAAGGQQWRVGQWR